MCENVKFFFKNRAVFKYWKIENTLECLWTITAQKNIARVPYLDKFCKKYKGTVLQLPEKETLA